MANSADNDPFVALIRAAAPEPETAKRLCAAMQEESVQMYRGIIPGPGLEERIDSVGAYLIGVTFCRQLFKRGPLAEMSDDELIRHLVPNLRHPARRRIVRPVTAN